LPTCPQPQQQIQKSNHSRGLNAHRFSRGGEKISELRQLKQQRAELDEKIKALTLEVKADMKAFLKKGSQ
jgi:hypothetical protein